MGECLAHFVLPVNCVGIEVLVTRWRLDSCFLPAVVRYVREALSILLPWIVPVAKCRDANTVLDTLKNY